MDKQQNIINYLKKNKQVSTSKIASAIKSDIWMCEKYLNQLEKNNKIKKTIVPNATYWELTSNSNKQGGKKDDKKSTTKD